MKRLWLFGFMVLGLFSCSTLKQTSLQEASAPQKKEIVFMSHEDIVAQLTSQEKAQMDAPLSDEAKKRKAMLVPLDEFIPKKDRDRIDLKRDVTKKLMKSFGLQKGEKDREGADLRYRDTTIKSQWNGTCTTFAGVASIENMLGKKIELSERDSWDKYRVYSCEAFVNTYKNGKNKICYEKDWPQGSVSPSSSCKNNRFFGLKDVKYLDDDVDLALDALDKKDVVYLGMSTPNDMLSCRSVIRTTTTASGGGHALAIVGYQMDDRIQGGGYFIIKNSWGEDCGDHGYQYVPFSLCNKSGFYCVMWDFMSVIDESGDTPVPNPDVDYEWVKMCYRKSWPPKCWSARWCGCYYMKKVQK